MNPHPPPSPADAVTGNSTQRSPFVWRDWLPAAWFAALLLVCYMPTLIPLVDNWRSDEDMGHGFFVPIVTLYIVWQRRDDLKFPAPPNWWGLALVLWSMLQLYIATLGAELFLARTSFVFAVIGVCLLLCGTANFRHLAFPLLLLLFMVPLPAIIFNKITFPLQLFASEVAEVCLSSLGIPVLRDGNVLELPSQRLSVVEACSGIRSLLSLTFLSLIYGAFFETRPWMRLILFLATIPIAITANAARVTITGILSEYKKELAEGIYHSMEGWVIFVISLAGLVFVHWLARTIADRYTARRAA